MKNQIKLVQSPVITHKLQEAGKEVSKRIDELELDKQIATVETVKSLKDLRAELNKELADFESQRKLIKEGVNNPYNEFETVYKAEIAEKYKAAIDLLKDKIAFVEDKVKSDKKKSIESYFNELCVFEKIDFITFDKLGIEINLSTTEKKYKEQIFEYITKVVDDLNLIKSTDFEAEILTEYKSSLNASKAITDVKTRKEKERIETERLKAERTQARKAYLLSLGMKYEEITNTYEFNADIYLTISDINLLDNNQYIAKVSECEAKIKDLKAKELASKTLEVEANPEVVIPTKKEVATPVAIPVSKPIEAPKVETVKEVEPLKTASFEVTATMAQLRALGAYMKENNISYKNI
jgi:hypothetical protein